MDSLQAQNILNTFLHVQDGGRAEPLPVTASFWADLSAGRYPQLEQGRLLSAYTFNEPWPVWERHPAGEEFVMLLSGTASFLLDMPGGEQVVRLDAPGAYVLVPRGVWHTATTVVPTTMIFLTPGAGTEHRQVRSTELQAGR